MGRLLTGAALAAVAAVAAVAAPASGASAVMHDRFTETFTDTDFCGSGLTVENAVRGVQNFTDDSSGFKASGSVRDVITNPANGKSVVVSSAGQFTSTLVDGDLEGVHRFAVTAKGLAEKIRTAHGRVLLRDAGLITFLDTFDGDQFISGEIVVNRGPHPEADSGFRLFCDTVVPALT